jgi:hypothetical protein
LISYSPQNETRSIEFCSSIREREKKTGGEIEIEVKAEEIGNPISGRYSGLMAHFIGGAFGDL